MSKMSKRFVSCVLAVAMMTSLAPSTAFATDGSTESVSTTTENSKQSANGKVVEVNNAQSLKDAIENAADGTETTISIEGEITLSSDLEIPANKIITICGKDASSKITTSETNTILVNGTLTLKQLQVVGNMSNGYALITLTKDNAKLYTENVTLTNTGNSASGFTASAQGIQIATSKGSSTSTGIPQQCVIQLKDSSINLNGNGARGICFAGASEGTVITLDNTRILNGTDAQNEWLGGYSRGLALWNATNMTINIQNNSQIAGFQYAINSGRETSTTGLKIYVDNSDIRGWASFNIWSDAGIFSISNSTLTGMNGNYNGDKKYSFSAFVINRDIYNNGWGQAENNKVILNNTTVNAITNDDQPVETLLRIDVDSTDVEFQGTVTFNDNTNGKADAVFDIGNMDNPLAFIERHQNLTTDATILCPNGNSLFYVLKNTFGDGKVNYGGSFSNFIGGVDYAGAADNKETVILLKDVDASDFAVNAEKGHGNEYGGWTLDLAGYTLNVAEWSGDKIHVIDSSLNKTGNIIVNNNKVLKARIGNICYTSFEAALQAANDNDTLELIADANFDSIPTIDETITIAINDNITVTGFNNLKNSDASLILSAGTYDAKPDDNSIAAGYKVKDLGNGTYKVIDADIHTITFDANGGSCDTVTADTNGNGVLTTLPTATRDGYTFDGWFTAKDGGEAVNENYTFSADTTLYAHWTKNSSGGGTVTPTPDPEEPSDSEETVTNPDGSTTTTITKEDGSSSTTTVGTDGKVESDVTVSEEAVSNADGAAVALPIPEVPVTSDRDTAPTVTVNLPSKDATKVEVPVKDVTPGTVAVLVDADGNETVIKDTVQSENGIIVEITDGTTIKVVDNSKSFDDVTDNYWGADAIDFATSRELFAGTGENTFSPEGDMTRAMIWSVLARYEGADTSGASGDEWYAGPQKWAIENGISDGTMANSSMTREQLAAMLYRYVGSPAVSGTVGDYSDADSISSWASDAMVWAVQEGLIAGMGENTLNPQGTATRTQVAAILQRFIENKMA